MKKTDELVNNLIEEMERLPIIVIACKNVGITRQTFYRWRDEDPEFRKRTDDALEIGKESINDLAESKLIECLQEKTGWAVRFWLSNKHRDYIRPRHPNFFQDLLGTKENRIESISIDIVTKDNKEMLEEIEELKKKHKDKNPNTEDSNSENTDSKDPPENQKT